MVSIPFEKVTLSNGMDVVLHQDHATPLVSVNVWYHVGSKDEEPGRTGFAHLFEHVMFEGSKHHNRSHFEPLQKAGANLNGSTTQDRTNYWEDVPSNYLELALWLEADRMGFLLDALDQQRFDIQRDVVKNERRQTYENRPYGMAHWHVQEALFPMPHPYHWMTIGSQEDLDAAKLEDIKDFFNRFYSPSNSSLAIAGDFQRDEAMALVEKYFGSLPPGPPVRRIGRFESSLPGRVELELRDKVLLPRLYISWPAPAEFTPDEPALEVLRAVLGDGLSSRLHRALVYEKQIAQSVSVQYYSGEIAGEFTVSVTAAADHSLAEVEAATDTELARLQKEPPTNEELAQAKNRFEAQHFRSLARVGGFGGKADQLNHFNIFTGDPGRINTSLQPYLEVKGDDVLRVHQSVLGQRQVRLRVLPEPSLKASTTGVDRTVMPAAGREPSFTPPLPQRGKLSNGLNLVVVEKRDLPIVAFGLVFSAGAATDPTTLPGLSAFTAGLLEEGTTRRSSQEIARAFEFIGARLSTDPRREYTLLSTETLSKHWPAALDLVAELVREPTFPEHELERVRREHLTDLRRAKDDAGAVADRIMPGLVFGRTSGYGHPVSGTEESVQALSRQDIVAQFQRHYSPASATLLVAGDVTLEEAKSRAESAFGGWKAPRPARTTRNSADGESGAAPATIYLVDRPGAAQSVIRAGHVTVPRQHPDFHALTLVNYAFGGQFSARLNLNLRQDKGYSYGFNSGVSWYRGPSVLAAGGSVQTAVTKESVQETLKEFQDIHGARPLTAEELESSKAGMLRSYPSSFEQPSQVLGQLINLVVHDLPNDHFRTVSAKVAAVSLADARRVASERIDPGQLRILVVGDRQTVEAGLRELGLPVVLLDRDGLETT
ncbi:MAG: insulinase family protein [Dehalococcoidia bacterium]|nr:insulinase family protein [Dehalococcoidia bacterium]MSQ16817.1 insulinase family protein [Dehalococcoidia bacterium]